MLSSTKKVLGSVTTGVLVLMPLLALGVGNFDNSNYIGSIFTKASSWVNTLIPIIIGLAFIYFAWTLISYIRSSGDEKEKNKSQLIWSVIAIVLIVSVWGIADLLQGIFGITTTNTSVPVITGAGSAITN